VVRPGVLACLAGVRAVVAVAVRVAIGDWFRGRRGRRLVDLGGTSGLVGLMIMVRIGTGGPGDQIHFLVRKRGPTKMLLEVRQSLVMVGLAGPNVASKVEAASGQDDMKAVADNQGLGDRIVGKAGEFDGFVHARKESGDRGVGIPGRVEGREVGDEIVRGDVAAGGPQMVKKLQRGNLSETDNAMIQSRNVGLGNGLEKKVAQRMIEVTVETEILFFVLVVLNGESDFGGRVARWEDRKQRVRGWNEQHVVGQDGKMFGRHREDQVAVVPGTAIRLDGRGVGVELRLEELNGSEARECARSSEGSENRHGEHGMERGWSRGGRHDCVGGRQEPDGVGGRQEPEM
jgi:hypothetical protein